MAKNTLRRSAAKVEHSKAVPIEPQLQSALLRLPGELRNHIYQFVFRDDENLCVVDYDPGEAHKEHVRAKMRRLLGLDCLRHVCRQLRLETAGKGRLIENVAGFLCPNRISSVTTDIAWVTFWYSETFVYQSMWDCLRVSKRHPQACVNFLIKEKVLAKGKIAPFVNHASMRFLLRRYADELGLELDVTEIAQSHCLVFKAGNLASSRAF